MKKAPATWITLEASQALTEWMATLQQGIMHAAEAEHQKKMNGGIIELSDVLEVLPVACHAWLETIDKHVPPRQTRHSKVA